MDDITPDAEKYEAFMVLHAGELRAKSIAAVEAGVECIICDEPLKLDSMMPWLVCKNNHKTRPWSDDEIEAMDRERKSAMRSTHR